MLKFSIVIPIYNTEKYLNKCINSVLNQTYKNYELIMVNDGSTDASQKICEEYVLKDNRVILINQKNKGLSGARNRGLDIATGDYIFFLDSDDYIYENTFEKLYNLLDSVAKNADLIIFNLKSKFAKDFNFPNSFITKKQCLGELYNNIAFVTACSKLYKSSIFENLRFKEGVLYEDEFLCHKLFVNVGAIYLTNDILYYYRETENSITTKKMTVRNLDIFFALDERVKILKSEGFSELLPQTYSSVFYLTLTRYAAIFPRNNAEKSKKKAVKNLIKNYRIDVANISAIKAFIFYFAIEFPSVVGLLYKGLKKIMKKEKKEKNR